MKNTVVAPRSGDTPGHEAATQGTAPMTATATHNPIEAAAFEHRQKAWSDYRALLDTVKIEGFNARDHFPNAAAITAEVMRQLGAKSGGKLMDLMQALGLTADDVAIHVAVLHSEKHHAADRDAKAASRNSRDIENERAALVEERRKLVEQIEKKLRQLAHEETTLDIRIQQADGAQGRIDLLREQFPDLFGVAPVGRSGIVRATNCATVDALRRLKVQRELEHQRAKKTAIAEAAGLA